MVENLYEGGIIMINEQISKLILRLKGSIESRSQDLSIKERAIITRFVVLAPW
uniref:Uncharacterized protein n=1 Tax=Manihot esculenta TaxID=3983 RepID=A0A2C9UW80_MANES